MGISFVGTASPAAVASGNLTFTEPTGTEEGDTVIASISFRSTAAFSLPDANWHFVASQLTGGNTVAAGTGSIGSGLMAYYVRGPSAPSLIFTRTGGDVAIGTIDAYRGLKLLSPNDTGVASTLGAASATVTAGSITTAAANELLVAAALAARGNSASAFTAATDPTGSSGATDTNFTKPTVGTWIERSDASTTTGADAGIAVADAIKSTAGATGTLQYTSSSSAQHSLIVGAFQAETSYPAIRSIGSIATVSGGASTCNPGLPSGWQPGDIIVLLIWSVEHSSGVQPGVTTKWTQLGGAFTSGSLGGGTGSVTAWYLTADSNFVLTDLLSGVGGTDPLGGAGAIAFACMNTSGIESDGVASAGSSTTSASRSVTTTKDYELAVSMFVCGDTNQSGRQFTAINSGGWAERYHAPSGEADVSILDRVKVRAGSITGLTETLNVSCPSCVFTFALKAGSGALPFTFTPMMHMLMR